MIFDTIENSKNYCACHKAFAMGFDFLRKAVAEDLAPGLYTLDGKNVYASIQAYTTKPAGDLMEAHRDYIDIQHIVSGEEKIECANLAECLEAVPYDPEKDAAFYTCPGKKVILACKAGDFAVFYPWDAHKPGIRLAEPVPVKKIVVKVRI